MFFSRTRQAVARNRGSLLGSEFKRLLTSSTTGEAAQEAKPLFKKSRWFWKSFFAGFTGFGLLYLGRPRNPDDKPGIQHYPKRLWSRFLGIFSVNILVNLCAYSSTFMCSRLRSRLLKSCSRNSKLTPDTHARTPWSSTSTTFWCAMCGTGSRESGVSPNDLASSSFCFTRPSFTRSSSFPRYRNTRAMRLLKGWTALGALHMPSTALPQRIVVGST